MSVRLTIEAELDLADIFVLGNARFGRRQAEKYLSSLQGVFTLIGTQPRMASERMVAGRSVRAHPFGAHVILYELDDLGILILRVRDAREDWLGEPSI
jgi:toxin ParE1/3/4